MLTYRLTGTTEAIGVDHDEPYQSPPQQAPRDHSSQRNARIFAHHGAPRRRRRIADLIREAVDAHSARYTGFIINFALGFQTSTLEMFRWLLWPVLTADVADLERGLKYGELRTALNEQHPEAPINAGNITQALQSVASLQVGKMAIKPIILDYDETNRRLNVVDRSFLIWIQHQD